MQIIEEQSIRINVKEMVMIYYKFEYNNFHDLQDVNKKYIAKMKIFKLKRNKDINQIMRYRNNLI